MGKVVVTSNTNFVSFLRESGLVGDDVRVIPHATPDDVRGKHVIGSIPLSLAALADSVTEIPINVTRELQGKELDLTTLRKVAGKPITYKVTVVQSPVQDTIKNKEVQTTFFQKKSQNGRWGLALIGSKTAEKYGIESALYGKVWMGYSYEDAGTIDGVKVYRLVPASGKFVLAAFQDITPLTGCHGVNVDLQGNSSISIITGDPATAVWRQWAIKRRSSILMHLDKSGDPRKIEAHEAIAMGLGG